MKYILFGSLILLFTAGCKEEESPAASTPAVITVTDGQLYQMALTTHKAAFYKNSTDTIPGNSGAAHAGKVLVWYNAKAKDQLDAQGKVKSAASFADSSLIVKEIFNTSGTKLYYAIMFKLAAASNKGDGGWVWAELKSDGSPFISASENGKICGPCHSAGTAYTRMNDTHP
jgi:hypothetical protein